MPNRCDIIKLPGQCLLVFALFSSLGGCHGLFEIRMMRFIAVLAVLVSGKTLSSGMCTYICCSYMSCISCGDGWHHEHYFMGVISL